jgi:hypothetical protein
VPVAFPHPRPLTKEPPTMDLPTLGGIRESMGTASLSNPPGGASVALPVLYPGTTRFEANVGGGLTQDWAQVPAGS